MIARFLSAAAACALLAPAAAHAQSETSASADIYLTGGYSNNPFSASGGGKGSAFGSVAVKPRVAVKSERSTFTVDGDVSLQEYAEHYSLVDSYMARVRYDGTPSERISTNLQASYSDRFIGAFDFLSDIPDVTEPDPVTGSDLGFAGERTRRRSIEGQGGVTARISERGELALTGFGADAAYSGGSGFDYLSYGSSLGYSHRLSEHSNVGLRLSVSKSDYESVIIPDSNVYSGQVTYSTSLSERWTMKSALGVTLTESQGGGNQVTATGSLSLCNRREKSNFCLSANRAVLPSGVLGTVQETRVEANYSLRVSEYGTFNASASFARADSERGAGAADRDYGYASLGYSHRLGERLNLTSNAFYRTITQGNLGSGDDFGGQVGLVYRLGDIR